MRSGPDRQLRRLPLYEAVILGLMAGYVAQMFTPLRLHPDTVVLLSMAESSIHGGGFLFHGKATVFPPGYPALMATLLRLNLAHPWVIAGLNLVFLA